MSAANPSATTSHFPALDASDWGPHQDVGERRPGQEEETEQRPDPRVEGAIDLVAEDPPDEKRETRADEAGDQHEAAHSARL